MNPAAKLAAFAGALVLLFGGGAFAGGFVGPDRTDDRAAPAHSDGGHVAREESNTVTASHPAHSSAAAEPGAQPVRGLAVAEKGLRVAVDDPELTRGSAETLRFRIVDDRGTTVRDFDVEHDKRMHLIVARRDLTGFQHLHPDQRADGSWSVRVRIEAAGSYRLFADFARDGKSFTLASDLRVDGTASLKPLPPARATAVSDGGYDVRLKAGTAKPGQETDLRFTITRDDTTVHTEPYLGAGGHLVALREGDLAFLHVHPSEHGDEAAGEHDDAVGFGATFPTEGRYRLFLQFKHEGRVQTVAFTQEVS